MKSVSLILAVSILLGLSTFHATSLTAQVVEPQKSAKAAALSDAQFIAGSIAKNEDMMFLSRKAIDRATDERVKELAQQMLEDHTAMLYSMEQLKGAGTGSSNQGAGSVQQGHGQTAALNGRLSDASGPDFDTLWVSNLLIMQQARYDELTQAKETVTNPQLKMAITEAVPTVRKHVSLLKSIQKYLARIALQKKKEAAAEQRSR